MIPHRTIRDCIVCGQKFAATISDACSIECSRKARPQRIAAPVVVSAPVESRFAEADAKAEARLAYQAAYRVANRERAAMLKRERKAARLAAKEAGRAEALVAKADAKQARLDEAQKERAEMSRRERQEASERITAALGATRASIMRELAEGRRRSGT